jgi:hypothetical protein
MDKNRRFPTLNTDGRPMTALGRCSYCNRIHIDNNQWFELNDYALQHLDAEFFHHTCPDCHTQEHDAANQNSDSIEKEEELD